MFSAFRVGSMCSWRRLLRTLPCAMLLALSAEVPAATTVIGGQVLLDGAPVPGVQIVGAKASCTASDAAGNYTCSAPAPWSGTLAAIANGFTFSPPSYSFAVLASSVSGANFAASPAFGLRVELALYRPATGRYLLDFDFDSQPDSTVGFGAPSDVPLAGDVDGDGASDLVVFRAGLWYADTRLTGVADRIFAFGQPGDIPLLADLDSDGSADLVLFRGGAWYVSATRTGVPTAVYHFGAPGDLPVLGDFNGDGIVDLGVYRSGTWYIDTGRDGIADRAIAFGAVAGDVPVALDFDGDGRTDLGLFRDGLWYVDFGADGTLDRIVGYGTAGDRPLGGYFNRSNTLFVRAGGACASACTQSNPYGSIMAAWKDAADGQIIRIARGTYAENLVFSHPGNQYAPGKFGKNSVKLLGTSKYAVAIAPAAGDALELQGASGYFVRGVTLRSRGPGGRGLVLSGGPGSYVPSFPGAQVNVALMDSVENDGHNVLLTGSANAWMRYTRIDRSRSGNGVSAWSSAYLRIANSQVTRNGYAVAPGPPVPGVGRGFEIRDEAELDARRNLIRENLTFGAIGVDRSKVSLANNTIESNGYNGTIFCGVVPNDRTESTLTGNWIAANGTADPVSGYNGAEYYATCAGNHSLAANTFVGNTLNGVFVGSGTVTLTGNTFRQNRIGMTLFANDGVANSVPSSTDTTVAAFGNLFERNTVDGIYAERYLTTSGFRIIATIGGTAMGQANTFRDHVGAALHAISCLNVTSHFACPVGGNVFFNNNDNIEAACPSTCAP